MIRTVRLILKTIVVTVGGLTIVGALAAVAFIYSGIYDIGASGRHLPIVRWALLTTQQQSVQRHAADIVAPPLDDPELIRHGFVLYQAECLVCHGAPGVARDRIGRGINPNPPPLITEVAHWTDAELYWVIENGLKMAGMPAFGTGLSETDIWAMTAFVRRLAELSQEEYLAMVAWEEGELPAEAVEWVEDDDPGFLRMVVEGDPKRGEELLEAAGCTACHRIPGVRGSGGYSGPPLYDWAERHFIAGSLVNTPENLVRWIVEPDEIEPGTTMPDLDVSPEDALDMAAYLYTLGEAPLALHTIRRTQEP